MYDKKRHVVLNEMIDFVGGVGCLGMFGSVVAEIGAIAEGNGLIFFQNPTRLLYSLNL